MLSSLVRTRAVVRSVGVAMLTLILIVLAAGVAPWTAAQSAASPAAASEAGPGDADPELYAAVRPAERATLITETAGHLSRYRIDAALEPGGNGGPGTIEGTQHLRFVNGTGADLEEFYFRLYPNGAEYAEGGLEVRDVTVDGAPARTVSSVADTALRVDLPAPLPAGDGVDVAMAFTTTIPVAPTESYGIFSIQPRTGTWALAHWHPILAGYDPTTGWLLDPLSVNGDPIFSTTALYDVTLTGPRDQVVVTSGRHVGEDVADRTGGDHVRRRYVTGPVRDFMVVADDDFEAVSQEVDGTTVTSYYNPGHAAGGAEVLRAAVQALKLFNDRFGPYPYAEMDLAETRLRGAGGVEFPQLMLIGSALYEPNPEAANPHYLEFVTAHEVAHQWWYGLVGNNQYVDAFIDEGLAEYVSSAVYFEAYYPPAEAARQLNLEVKLWYLETLFTDGDEVVDQPTDDFTGRDYGAMVYGKGALGFGALREEIGDEAFYRGLHDYHARFRFGVATPADLRTAFERASGKDLTEFWRHWFEAAEGTEDYSPEDLIELRETLGR